MREAKHVGAGLTPKCRGVESINPAMAGWRSGMHGSMGLRGKDFPVGVC